jgi:hypothetical protein
VSSDEADCLWSLTSAGSAAGVGVYFLRRLCGEQAAFQEALHVLIYFGVIRASRLGVCR